MITTYYNEQNYGESQVATSSEKQGLQKQEPKQPVRLKRLNDLV